MTISKQDSERRIMLEVASSLARVWVLSGAPEDTNLYIYVDRKWVEITIRHNGELEQPRRRVEDKA